MGNPRMPRSRSPRTPRRRSKSGRRKLPRRRRSRGVRYRRYRASDEQFQEAIEELGFVGHMGQINGLKRDWESVSDAATWRQFVSATSQRAVADAERKYQSISLDPIGLHMFSGELIEAMDMAIKTNARGREEWETALHWLLDYVSENDILNDALNNRFGILVSRFRLHPNFDASVVNDIRHETVSTNKKMSDDFVLIVSTLYEQSRAKAES